MMLISRRYEGSNSDSELRGLSFTLAPARIGGRRVHVISTGMHSEFIARFSRTIFKLDVCVGIVQNL
jgi:hypothetical protein